MRYVVCCGTHIYSHQFKPNNCPKRGGNVDNVLVAEREHTYHEALFYSATNPTRLSFRIEIPKPKALARQMGPFKPHRKECHQRDRMRCHAMHCEAKVAKMGPCFSQAADHATICGIMCTQNEGNQKCITSSSIIEDHRKCLRPL